MGIIMERFKPDHVIREGVHGYTRENSYIRPPKEVEEKLEWFQDRKLALMVHMGLYCEIGVTASWGLSDQDAAWSRKDIADWHISGKEYRKEYFNLNRSFNPVRFDPEQWAELAAENGFQYLIFTTKHHDGFCLWDTKETDYKTTSPDCPYSRNMHADIVKSVFNAFRAKGLGIAAYFSKPDWHSEYYWAEGMEHSEETWRMTSYDPNEHPELWERFVTYTQNQLLELTTCYGDIDILWLDGGQVNPKNGLDIRLGEVVKKARELNPSLIVADRTVGGEYENYVTPEQTVPEEAMNIPWESNVSLGRNYTYRYDDTYKDLKTILHLLIDVVCKGGNLALNISPQPDGRFPKQGIEIMKGIGSWMRKYGEAIYRTRICAPYKECGIAFTKNDNYVYAFMTEQTEDPKTEIVIPCHEEIDKVELMNTGEAAAFRNCPEGIRVVTGGISDEIALVFRMKPVTIR